MALSDLFKNRKANKINDAVWTAIWAVANRAPADDGTAKQRYLVFLGSLIYVTRYQAALAAGMEATIATSSALLVVGRAGYPRPMEQAILNIFSKAEENPAAVYAASLNAVIGRLTSLAVSGGQILAGPDTEALLAEVVALEAVLAEALPEADPVEIS